MSEQGAPIICIKDLHFSREKKSVFAGLNIKVQQHKITAILGPSGTGKTTLLQLIGRQLLPDSGQITVDARDIADLSRKQLFRLRRRMGVLFQGGALFTDFNVYENVAFPLREHARLPEDMVQDLVLMMLEAVGLRGAVNLRIDQLSGGMARRVALARSVILGPDIMMYDEPFTGQDPIARGVLLSLIKQMNDALNLTSIVISHDVLETARIADYVYLLAEGRVLAEGTPEQMFNDESPLVKQFVQGNPDGPISFHYPVKPFEEALYD